MRDARRGQLGFTGSAPALIRENVNKWPGAGRKRAFFRGFAPSLMEASGAMDLVKI